ncbi:MAG: hypothetical protein AB8E82_06820 [Aureispira sp.]
MTTTISYTTVILTSEHIDAVLALSDEQMGKGFLSKQTIRQYIRQANYFGQVVVENGRVLGFSLMEIVERAQLAKRLKSAEQWFLAYFAAYERLGYRSLTAVASHAQGQGIGSHLVQEGLKMLAKKVPVVVCEAWQSNQPSAGRSNVFLDNGYKALKVCSNFWKEESVQKKYTCSICGTPPCQCTAVIYGCFFEKMPKHWWVRPDLSYQNQQLHFAGHNIWAYAQNKKTPFYIYSLPRIQANYERLAHALDQVGVSYRIHYAMKANRHGSVLSHLRSHTHACIDVCSPRELQRALEMGFEPQQITYTNTSVSEQDLAILAKHPNIAINLDALSSIRRFANWVGKRDIGIRINSDVGMAYEAALEYAGRKVFKFGIYQEQWAELQQLIDRTNFRVTTVHCHAGSGFLSDQLSRLDAIFEVIDQFLALFPHITTLNLGGGLGVPQKEGDQPLDVEKWAVVVGTYAQKRKLTLCIEPGDYIVKDAGLLITQVNTLEHKRGQLFVGVDTGMNMNYEPAYYNMNLEPVPLKQIIDGQLIKGYLAGNINEPIDLLSSYRTLPPVQEGDYLALINTGGYGSSPSSDHCMRGDFEEYVLYDKKKSSNFDLKILNHQVFNA